MDDDVPVLRQQCGRKENDGHAGSGIVHVANGARQFRLVLAAMIDGDLVAGVDQFAGEVWPDETSAADDQDTHFKAAFAGETLALQLRYGPR